MDHMESLSLLQFFFLFVIIIINGWEGELHLIGLAARTKISVWRRADFLKIKKKGKERKLTTSNSPFDLLINTFQMLQ